MEPHSKPHDCTRLHTVRRQTDFHYSTLPVVFKQRDLRHHTLVMLTAARPRDSLPGTLDTLDWAGISHWNGPKILLSDGRHADLPDDWLQVVYPRQGGSALGFIRALRHALANDPHLESITFLEDDVDLCKSALDYMTRVTIPESLAFVSWFTYDYDYASPLHSRQSPHPSESSTPVLAIRPSRFFILIQACTFPRRTVDRLLSCPGLTEEWPKREGHDEMVAFALGDSPYATHFPILVQHEGGLNSAVVLDRISTKSPADASWSAERRSPYFKGVHFDANSLIPK